ncbi:hypothetical protein TKK_0016507 [Trichogramma kaykai]
MLILIIYVDDGAIACKKIEYLPDQSMLLHQKSYAEKVVEKYNLLSSNTVNIPIDPNTLSTIFEKLGGNDRLNVPYKEAIGSLMFLANITRPDLAFSVGVLSRYAENPTKVH